jgi:hypothetical protein
MPTPACARPTPSQIGRHAPSGRGERKKCGPTDRQPFITSLLAGASQLCRVVPHRPHAAMQRSGPFGVSLAHTCPPEQ